MSVPEGQILSDEEENLSSWMTKLRRQGDWGETGTQKETQWGKLTEK